MFIHKMAITTCATGFLVTDETDPDESYPLGAFGDGQLLNALSFVKDNIEHEMKEHAQDLAAIAASRSGNNVVPGPGFKQAAADPAITRPIKTDREIVDEVNALATRLARIAGYTPAVADFRFYKSGGRSPIALKAWRDAAEIYEEITGSEVSDALQVVLEEDLETVAAEEPIL